MRQENDAVFNYLQKYSDASKKIGGKSDNSLFRIVMDYYGRTVMPTIGIADGGRERGQFYGFLRKVGIILPETVLRDKSFIRDSTEEFTQASLTQGIREGQGLSFNNFVVKLKTHMSSENYQKFRERIHNYKLMRIPVEKMLRERFKR